MGEERLNFVMVLLLVQVLDLDLQDDGHEEAAAEYDRWYLHTEMKGLGKKKESRSNSLLSVPHSKVFFF